MTERFTSISRQRLSQQPAQKKSFSAGLLIIIIFIFVGIVGYVWYSNRKVTEDVVTEDSASDSESESEITTEPEDTEEEEITVVDVTEKSSDSDADYAPSEFLKTDQTAGDENQDSAIITKIEHKGYDGFFRITFHCEFENGLPYVSTTYQPASNQLLLQIDGLSEDNGGIVRGTSVDVTGSVVSSIFHQVKDDPDSSYYSIGIKSETGFYLQAVDDSALIILDIEEQEIGNGNGEEFVFSTDQQAIDGDAQGNVVTFEGISHSDQSSYYRVIFRLKTFGQGIVPDASAELVDYEGSRAIKLEVRDMYDDFFGRDGYNADFGNALVTGMIGSYSENISTYYIKINSDKEFKLHYMKAPAQLMVDVSR